MVTLATGDKAARLAVTLMQTLRDSKTQVRWGCGGGGAV